MLKSTAMLVYVRSVVPALASSSSCFARYFSTFLSSFHLSSHRLHLLNPTLHHLLTFILNTPCRPLPSSWPFSPAQMNASSTSHGRSANEVLDDRPECCVSTIDLSRPSDRLAHETLDGERDEYDMTIPSLPG